MGVLFVAHFKANAVGLPILDHQKPLEDVEFDVDYLKPTKRKPPSTYLKESLTKNKSPNAKTKTPTPSPMTPFSHPVL